MADISILNGYNIKDKESRDLINNHIFGNPIGAPSAQLINVFNQFIATTPLSGDNNFKALQGAVYIPEDNHFIIAFSNSPTYTQAILVVMDRDFNVIARSAAINVGHCGDMTYNPSEQSIYCSIGTEGSYAGKIAIVNKNTLTVTNYVNSPSSRAVKLVSYDDINNVYYIEDDIHLFKCDASFNIIESYDLSIVYGGVGTAGHQSSFCYNGIFYMLYSNNIRGAYNNAYILSFKDGNVLSRLALPTPSSTFEPEGVMVDGDIAYITYGQSWLSICKFDLSGRVLMDSIPVMSDGMVQLNDGDLDNLPTGDYIIRDATAAANIANTPIDNYGMRIKCFFLANFMYQVADTLDMYTYIRRCASGAWASWHNISSRTVALTPTYNSALGNRYGVQVYQQGGSVTVTGLFNGTYPAATWTTIMTLPVKPSSVVHAMGITMLPTAAPVEVRVQTNGEVQAYPDAQCNEVRLNISFAID